MKTYMQEWQDGGVLFTFYQLHGWEVSVRQDGEVREATVQSIDADMALQVIETRGRSGVRIVWGKMSVDPGQASKFGEGLEVALQIAREWQFDWQFFANTNNMVQV